MSRVEAFIIVPEPGPSFNNISLKMRTDSDRLRSSQPWWQKRTSKGPQRELHAGGEIRAVMSLS